MLADILANEPEVEAIAKVIALIKPDVIALTDFDYDHDQIALTEFAALISEFNATFPYLYAPLPNSGRPSGVDQDGDGRFGEPEDAVGYGRFWGDSGIAVISRHPILYDEIRSFNDFIWSDLPDHKASRLSQELQRLPLSTSSHASIPIQTPLGRVTLLVSASTAPVFDGPEDRNGRRNIDELHLWRHLIMQADAPIAPPFVMAMNANLDPEDGEGFHDDLKAFLSSSLVIDPSPSSLGGAEAADADHAGPAALDTVDWPDERPGNLRVGYVLPDPSWTVLGSGVFWPSTNAEASRLLGADGNLAGFHRLVWVDLFR